MSYRREADGPYAAQVYDLCGLALEYTFASFDAAVELGLVLTESLKGGAQ